MTREEHWRQRLIELLADQKVTQADLALRTGIVASYVSRLLYPPEKKGRKNLGMETMRVLRETFALRADWFDLPLGVDLPSRPNAGQVYAVREPSPIERPPERWPFSTTTANRIFALKDLLGSKRGNEAIRDIDATLDVVVTKWERMAAAKARRGSAQLPTAGVAIAPEYLEELEALSRAAEEAHANPKQRHRTAGE